jgi:hypothetical protein
MRLRCVTFNIHSGINQEEDAYSLERIAKVKFTGLTQNSQVDPVV